MKAKIFQTPKSLFNRDLLSSWLHYLVIITLILGVFFRFINLDKKPFWFDETYTPLQASGYTERDVTNHFSDSRIITSSDLQQYLRPNPNGNFTDTIKSFAAEDPQHTPLYYLMTRFWMQLFGSSAIALRSLPAVLSLLAFPCLYWLCLELFGSPTIGLVAIGLAAVSPLHVLYAQEAREYMLWIVMTLLSSASLLRAMRLETRLSWALYAVTVTVSLYSFIFSAFVLAGHGLYILALEKVRFNEKVRSYIAASFLGVLPFLPWLFVIFSSLSQVEATSVSGVLDGKVPLLRLLSEWLRGIRLVFLDLNIGLHTPLIYRSIAAVFLVVLPIFIALAFYTLYRTTSKRTWLFVFILAGTTFLPLAVLDVVSGGIRSTIPRYVLPLCLGIQLASAYLIVNRLEKVVSAWKQRVWCFVVLTLFTCGIWSCVMSTQAENWWIKGQLDFADVTHVINKAERPLLIGNAPLVEFMALSYKLKPDLPILMQPNCFNCAKDYFQMFKPGNLSIPSGFQNIFVFQANPKKWLSTFQNGRGYRAIPITYKGNVLINYKGIRFWKLERLNA